MKKRLIDIYPPHSGKEALQEQEELLDEIEKTAAGSRKKSSNTYTFISIVLVFLLLSLPFAHFFFARATVQVWPHITKLRTTEQIVAQVGYDSLNLERSIIRARVFEEEAKQTMLFPASGKAFKETSAHGTIRVHNQNSTPQALVANTRFVSENGKIFRLESAISIPAGGSLDVSVVAAAPGVEYNIGPSNFSLPGLVGSPLYTKIYGESLQAMIGGAQQEVSIVQEEDIEAARDQLIETLKTEATKNLLAKVPAQFQVLADSLVVDVVEDNSLVKAEAELEEFNYTARVNVSMHAYHKDDANVLATHLLSGHLDENEAINEETLQIGYETSPGAIQNGVVPITVHAAADQYERVDELALSRRLGGISNGDVRSLMAEYPFLAKVQFSLWPFWVSRVPDDSKRIELEVILED